MADKITFSIKDFRAIKEANIKLNGITVVSGINGCGKSTISKFLYYNFLFASEYEDIVNKNLARNLSDFIYFIELFRKEILALDKNYTSYNKAYHYLGRPIRIRERNALLSLINELQSRYIQLPQRTEAHENRLTGILKNVLKYPEENIDFYSLIYILSERIRDVFDQATQLLNNRPLLPLQMELAYVFEDSILPGEFSISEYGDLVIGHNSETVASVYSMQKVAYIDTPMILGMQMNGTNDCWKRLNKILQQPEGSTYNKTINQLIRMNIMQGEAKYDKDISFGKFTFTHNNGETYNLLDCASGLKSFSILQLMLRNEFLTPNTLLIIDEPEVHLHPQWIVEYARLIVLLNKEIGVNFFIASHNPDMVSAIKYISEKEKTTNKLNFYLAEEDDTDKGRYTYRALGTDIEPIFKSFNIALDKINEYGIADEDDVL